MILYKHVDMLRYFINEDSEYNRQLYGKYGGRENKDRIDERFYNVLVPLEAI